MSWTSVVKFISVAIIGSVGPFIWCKEPFCLLLAGTFLLSGAFYQLYLYPKYLTPFRNLPTPENWNWLLGNCTDLISHSRKVLAQGPQFAKARLVRVYLPLNIEAIVVVSPQALSELLVERPHEFVQPKIVERIFSSGGLNGLLIANGHAHKVHRRHLAKAYSPRNIKNYFADFLEKGMQMVEAMKVEQSEQGGVLIGNILRRTVLDILSKTHFDYDYDFIRNESVAQQVHERFFDSMTPFHCIRALLAWAPPWKRQDSKLLALRAFGHQILERKGASTGKTNLLSCMIQSGAFNTEEMVDEILGMLLTGTGTTSMTMQWAIITLCKYPDIQRRLRQEIHDRLPSPADPEARQEFLSIIDDLPYLKAFCNELLRHYPIIQLFIRQAAHDTVLDVIPVPKGTLLLVPIEAFNHSILRWGPSAREFDPDRWLKRNYGIANEVDPKWAFMTFSQGPRSCIGQHFVKSELAFLVAILVGHFEMQMDDPEKDVGLAGTIVLFPRDEIVVRLRVLDGW